MHKNIQRAAVIIAAVIVLAGAVCWSVRIVRVNQVHRTVKHIHMGQSFDYNSCSVIPEEYHIFSVKEYKKFFGVEPSDAAAADMLLCLRFKFTNTSGDDMDWDSAMDDTSHTEGFESLTWMSLKDPFIGRDVNVFKGEVFKNGASQDIWYITNVSPTLYSKKNWKNIRKEKFYYVLTTEPVKEVIDLE